MNYGRIAGLEKPVSRLVMGVDNQTTLEHATIMFDDFLGRGGNTFDTAYVYGGGKCEQVFGEYLQHTGARDRIVVIGKGAHTPHCTPEGLSTQLAESLERMQLEHVDLYIMHRDNPEVPVGEFVDVLNQHRQAGKMRVFGGSNWSLERVRAANDYANANTLQGFGVVSNQLSLARMVDPVWAGCLSSSDAESRAWFASTQTPLFPWSSQARGFFVRANPEFTEDEELVRCWYADDNFVRLERTQHLAKQKGVDPIHLALAYVLNQPFPTFPLIGPRSVEETASSFKALEIGLSPQEARWLNLETETLT